MGRVFNDCASVGGNDAASLEAKTPVAAASSLHASLYPDEGEERESDEVEILSVSLTEQSVGMELPHDVTVGSIYNLSIGLAGQALHSQVKITSCQPIADGVYQASGQLC